MAEANGIVTRQLYINLDYNDTKKLISIYSNLPKLIFWRKVNTLVHGAALALLVVLLCWPR